MSSLALSPSTPDLLAAGSFSRTVGLYDSRSSMNAIQVFDAPSGTGVTDVSLRLNSHSAYISGADLISDPFAPHQLQFHGAKSELFVASRQSDQIVVFDLRQAAQPCRSFTRPGRTNQRLHFGLDASSSVLASGDQVRVSFGQISNLRLTSLFAEHSMVSCTFGTQKYRQQMRAISRSLP